MVAIQKEEIHNPQDRVHPKLGRNNDNGRFWLFASNRRTVIYVGCTSDNGHSVARELYVPSAGGVTHPDSRPERLPGGRVSTGVALGSIVESCQRPARIAW